MTTHPIFTSRYMDRIGDFLVLQLFRYLAFTMNLEMMVVNDNVRHLLVTANELGLGDEERLALHRIYVDEAYHALFCADFSGQLRSLTGLAANFSVRPRFMDDLDRLTGSAGTPNAASLIFVCVAETLITHNLRDVASDRTVPASVNQIMQDHARDEALHHNFFKRLLVNFYRTNTASFRDLIHLVPKSIMAFIQPDLDSLRLSLMQIGVSRDDAIQILAETYPTDVVSAYARHAARDLLATMADECASSTRLQDTLHEHRLI